MHELLKLLNDATGFLWTYVLVSGLLFSGAFFTISSCFVQVRYFGALSSIMKESFAVKKSGAVSSLQVLLFSIAGRVGAGNIAGIAVALAIGGPGSIFWMWVVGFLGMATSFYECTLAQLYKRREGSSNVFRGGPGLYIERGVKSPLMRKTYGILLFLTAGVGFIAVQSFTIVKSVEAAVFGTKGSSALDSYVITAVVVLLFAVVIIGGVKRIVKVSDIVVPIMSGLYIVCTLIVMVMHISFLPKMFMIIFSSAFHPMAVGGAAFGTVIMTGIRRGLFSNEAGLGTAPNTAAVALTQHPAEQGVIQALSVFFDTFFICTCTAFIVLISGLNIHALPTSDGVVLTQLALSHIIGPFGNYFIAVILCLFAFTTLMYNFYLGENGYLLVFRDTKTSRIIYRFIILFLIAWSGVQQLQTVFDLADLFMGLLAIINVVALFILYRTSQRVLKDFDQQNLQGKKPAFDPDHFSDLNLFPGVWNKGEKIVQDDRTDTVTAS